MDYSFKIINSSAGSGKTFNLAIEYICRLLRSNDDEHFKAMLALTFTNKASAEMKDRILIYLSDLKHQRNKIIQEIISNKNGKLEICSTANQDNPLMSNGCGGNPILCLDVWELSLIHISEPTRPY